MKKRKRLKASVKVTAKDRAGNTRTSGITFRVKR
jgi:hypothetical protein